MMQGRRKSTRSWLEKAVLLLEEIEDDVLQILGNTILVKLKLWELVIVFNKTFWSATNLCLRYASAKCGR